MSAREPMHLILQKMFLYYEHFEGPTSSFHARVYVSLRAKNWNFKNFDDKRCSSQL